MRPPHTTDERVVLERLRMVRVAKDLYLSQWYHEACDLLKFSPAGCDELARLAQETSEERDALMAAIDQWARQISGPDAQARAADVARVARRDFLLALIDGKDASADQLERAALLAPPGLRERMQELAAVDFRHANELRAMLVAEVQESLAARGERPV